MCPKQISTRAKGRPEQCPGGAAKKRPLIGGAQGQTNDRSGRLITDHQRPQDGDQEAAKPGAAGGIRSTRVGVCDWTAGERGRERVDRKMMMSSVAQNE